MVITNVRSWRIKCLVDTCIQLRPVEKILKKRRGTDHNDSDRCVSSNFTTARRLGFGGVRACDRNKTNDKKYLKKLKTKKQKKKTLSETKSETLYFMSETAFRNVFFFRSLRTKMKYNRRQQQRRSCDRGRRRRRECRGRHDDGLGEPSMPLFDVLGLLSRPPVRRTSCARVFTRFVRACTARARRHIYVVPENFTVRRRIRVGTIFQRAHNNTNIFFFFPNSYIIRYARIKRGGFGDNVCDVFSLVNGIDTVYTNKEIRECFNENRTSRRLIT